jgi:hypothetical protein
MAKCCGLKALVLEKFSTSKEICGCYEVQEVFLEVWRRQLPGMDWHVEGLGGDMSMEFHDWRYIESVHSQGIVKRRKCSGLWNCSSRCLNNRGGKM